MTSERPRQVLTAACRGRKESQGTLRVLQSGLQALDKRERLLLQPQPRVFFRCRFSLCLYSHHVLCGVGGASGWTTTWRESQARYFPGLPSSPECEQGEWHRVLAERQQAIEASVCNRSCSVFMHSGLASVKALAATEYPAVAQRGPSSLQMLNGQCGPFALGSFDTRTLEAFGASPDASVPGRETNRGSCHHSCQSWQLGTKACQSNTRLACPSGNADNACSALPRILEKDAFVLLSITSVKAPLPARATVPLRAQEALHSILACVGPPTYCHQVYAHVQALSRSPSPAAAGTLFTACSDLLN